MYIFYRQNIQTMIKDITEAKEEIKTNRMVVDGQRYKIDFTGLIFSVISDMIEQNRTWFMFEYNFSNSIYQALRLTPVTIVNINYIYK